jgi:hypothetical protein
MADLKAAEAAARATLDAAQVETRRLWDLHEAAVNVRSQANEAWAAACLAVDEEAPEDKRATIDGKRAVITRSTKFNIWARMVGERGKYAEQMFRCDGSGGSLRNGFYRVALLRFGWPP